MDWFEVAAWWRKGKDLRRSDGREKQGEKRGEENGVLVCVCVCGVLEDKMLSRMMLMPRTGESRLRGKGGPLRAQRPPPSPPIAGEEELPLPSARS